MSKGFSSESHEFEEIHPEYLLYLVHIKHEFLIKLEALKVIIYLKRIIIHKMIVNGFEAL
jgi:hypothetical protein